MKGRRTYGFGGFTFFSQFVYKFVTTSPAPSARIQVSKGKTFPEQPPFLSFLFSFQPAGWGKSRGSPHFSYVFFFLFLLSFSKAAGKPAVFDVLGQKSAPGAQMRTGG
jgi:hypothetical protein